MNVKNEKKENVKLVNLNYGNHQLNFVIIVHDIIQVVDQEQDQGGKSFFFVMIFLLIFV